MNGEGEDGADRDEDGAERDGETGVSNAMERPAMEHDGNARGDGNPLVECSVRIGGVDFSLVPTDKHVGVGSGREGAGAKGVTRRLWDARREARLTQAQLAQRLGLSQAMVSQAESGRDVVGERYLRRVLEACELPSNWGMEKGAAPVAGEQELDPSEIAGLDPQTCELVRRGSERDLELGRIFAWWDNFRSEG
jgi:transcriptional regulator with XRE-family HTH domain